MTRFLVASLLAWLVLTPGTAGAQSIEPARVAKIKSAYLLNFIRFANWPASAFDSPDTPFAICIAGHDSLGRYLELTIRDQTVAGRRISIRRLGPIAGVPTMRPSACHMLYVSSSELNDAGPVLRSLRGSTWLTVGETGEFATTGTMLALSLENDRIVFYANRDVIRAASIKLSSKILQLARTATDAKQAWVR